MNFRLKKVLSFSNAQLILFFSLALTLSAQAKLISADDYHFPLRDPYLSSISSGANTPLTPYEIIKVEVRTDRRDVPLLKDRNAVPLGLFEQKNQQAPLAFVISGTGGTALAGTALYLASELFLKGYHVVTLPDPISWHYVLGVSESSLPGDPLRDAPEYYKFMQKVVHFLKTQRHLNFTDTSLVGYSYGGLLSGFLAKEDDVQKVFNFNKIIIFNPPFNMKRSILLLDQYYDEGKKITFERKDIIISTIYSIAAQMQDTGFKLDIVGEGIKRLSLTKSESQWLIGESFRQNLADVIYTSQQVHDLRILKQRATSFHKRERLTESKTFGFREYFTRFLAPSLMPNRQTPTRENLEAMLFQADFRNLEEIIKTHKNIYILTNKDDFLIAPEDIDFLENAAQERFYLYPYGGHMGNLWFPSNRADYERIMNFRN